MKIAIDAADLCDKRVDGTRIYIKNVLDHLGRVSPDDSFLIYLKGEINPQLKFKNYSNYSIKKSSNGFFWTQTKFPFELRRDKPDVLWMPLQTIPFLTAYENKIKIVSTIHDLAFKYFRNHFPVKDYILLNLFTGIAAKKSDRLIAVSQNTKKDISRFYKIADEKMNVVHHGYDKECFNGVNVKDSVGLARIKAKYKIKGSYILYAGAIQPRKNLTVLIKAFEELKSCWGHGEVNQYQDLKLVLAGAKAWMAEEIYNRAKKSKYSQYIIFSGAYLTEDLPSMMGGAEVFVFPSLYEGFGIPVLEALACQVPVICADNSSLPEVGGNACQYFKAENYQELTLKLKTVLSNQDIRKEMIEKGMCQVEKFSWEKCAKETLKVLKS